MLYEKFLSSLFIIGMTTLPFIVHADIKIINHTSQFSTASINGTCSAPFPGGITAPGAENTVPDRLINVLCGFNADACLAKVFMTRDCEKSGGQVATVVYNIKRGIINIEPLSSTYHFIFDQSKPFEVTINS